MLERIQNHTEITSKGISLQENKKIHGSASILNVSSGKHITFTVILSSWPQSLHTIPPPTKTACYAQQSRGFLSSLNSYINLRF